VVDLFPASELAGKRIKLTIRREHSQWLLQKGREDLDQEIMGVGSESDHRMVADLEHLREVLLEAGNDGVKNLLPLGIVHEGSVFPGLEVARSGDIGPEVV
jgi:hypothetical protein